MRVVHVCSSLSPGGLSRIVEGLGLDPELELHLVTTNFPGLHYPDPEQSAWKTTSCLSATGKWSRYRQLFARLRALRPQVVHTHQEAYAPIVARLAGVPAVVETIHESGFWGRCGVAPVRWLRRQAVHRHVAVSSGQGEDLIRLGRLRSDQLCVIPNGVRCPDLLLERKAAQPPVLGCVARLEEAKGVYVLLQALRQLPEAQLLLVGDGPERARVEVEIQRLGLTKRVRLTGYVQAVEPFYAQMDVFVMPSFFEAFGLVCAEAMAQGVPVVASDLPGPASLCRNGQEGLLVPPGQPEVLAQACRTLLEQPQLAQRLRAAAYTRIKEEFSLQAMQRKHRELYAELLRAVPHRPEIMV